MITTEKAIITIGADINAPLEKVWTLWTDPRHIIHWNNASDDWFTPWAENDLRVGGRLTSRMEARDGSMGFDFSGTYKKIEPFKYIEYVIDDDRKVQVSFRSNGYRTTITETFEAEGVHPVEMQQQGWQSIMNNFKQYAEKSANMEMLHFEIEINASAERVYNTMLDERSFAKWTSEFNPSSRFEGNWKKGTRMRFLGMDQDGSLGGMVSWIRENIPGRFVSLEHLGEIRKGRDITDGPDVEPWAGALENYSFMERNGKTLLSVDMDASKDFIPYFRETWPKVLQRLKSICETE